MPTDTHTIDDYLAEARAVWPDAHVDAAVFEARARAALDAGATQLHAADLYLACGCAAGDSASIEGLERTVLPAIEGSVRRIDGDAQFADEVRQRLRDRLLVPAGDAPPRIAGYAGRGPLAAWVRVAAVRIALDLRRKTAREVPLADAGALDDAGDMDPQLAYLKRRYSSEFGDAFRRASRSLTDRERTLLRFSFADGLTIDQVADIYGVHRATAARWIARARENLLDRTRDDLRERLEISASEFDSVVRLVRSQVDVRISQLFAATDS